MSNCSAGKQTHSAVAIARHPCQTPMLCFWLSAGNRTCAILRAPWWNIVKANTPTILQSKTVTVYNKDGTELIEKRNPMRKYCFKVSMQPVRCGRHFCVGCNLLTQMPSQSAATMISMVKWLWCSGLSGTHRYETQALLTCSLWHTLFEPRPCVRVNYGHTAKDESALHSVAVDGGCFLAKLLVEPDWRLCRPSRH
jgi:hypothetical protein